MAQSNRKQNRRKQRRQLRPETKMFIKQGLIGFGLFLLLGALIAGVWYGTRVQSLTISEVTVVGGETVTPDELIRKTNDVLSDTYFRLIPKRFTWLYPKAEITNSIQLIPRVHNVQVTRVGTELTVVFDEYQPYALWCAEDARSECLFIDHTGYAFADAPNLRGESFVRYITLGLEPEVDETIVEREQLRTIEWYIDTLRETLGLYIVSVEIDLLGDMFFTLSGGGELKVSGDESKEDVLDNLSTILNSEEFSDLEPGNFRYIDLRFGNKVFVNEEIAVPVSTSTATSSENN